VHRCAPDVANLLGIGQLEAYAGGILWCQDRVRVLATRVVGRGRRVAKERSVQKLEGDLDVHSRKRLQVQRVGETIGSVIRVV